MRIEAQLGRLSRAEAQVAQWILRNPHSAAKDSISVVAAGADVSEPTVIRFCRSLDLDGFRELRTQLVLALQQPESFLHQEVVPDDDVGAAAGKVLDTSIQALVALRNNVSFNALQQAVDMLRSARQILFVGLGGSGQVAKDAEHKFFRLGIPCTAVTDIQTITQYASIAQAGDIFVATSHTGTWGDLVDAMQLARDNAANVIAITDPLAPLASTADLVFESHIGEDTSVYTPMSSRLVQLALLDALQVALAVSLGRDAEQRLRDSKDALMRYRITEQGGL